MSAILEQMKQVAAVSIGMNMDEPRTGQLIRETIKAVAGMPNFAGKTSPAEREEIARHLEEQYGITMGVSAIVADEDFHPWLRDARINGEIDDFFWNRYKTLLSCKGLPENVIAGIDDVTSSILDHMGNPHDQARWSRRGMVVGHVQSGKTANYTGLICKAADAGYRLIVVIAGIHNALRNQTQERIDEGFVGRDTGRMYQGGKSGKRKYIGVGNIDPKKTPVSLTTTDKDFNKATATTNTSEIGQYNVPVVLVIKKNYHTLQNLLEWLSENSTSQNQMVKQPMLLIDDEADNASINTAADPHEFTRINGQIRKLLSLFERSSYVGYTATPFANIFIDPDQDSSEVNRDIFPRHFIIGLGAPTNYIGAQKVFFDQEEQYIRPIRDNEDTLPLKHKGEHVVSLIPDSMLQAIRTFIVARAIRNLRGQQREHASMLVNASRFTNVQKQLRTIIAEKIATIRNAINVDGRKSEEDSLENPEISALNDVWKTEYKDVRPSDWPLIQKELFHVLNALEVVEVNQSSESLVYEKSREHGATIIAVGGLSLSRGLTLEGLTVSYFLRNSMMYDTLMQMGRWFGYRPGYEDLCRLWITEDAVGWYRHIHEAMDDLMDQLKKMQTADATPEQFGLAVRSHPESLLITARNKMRTGQTFRRSVSLAGEMVETTRVQAERDRIEENKKAGENLAIAIQKHACPEETLRKGNFFRKVPVSLIRDFLKVFHAYEGDPLTDPEAMDKYIKARTNTELKEWDVLFASAENKNTTINLAGNSMKPFERSVTDNNGLLAISGKSLRVGSPGDERIGLTKEQEDLAIEQFHQECEKEGKRIPRSLPPRIFRNIPGRFPLLILRFVKPKLQHSEAGPSESFLAWSIFFPPSKIAGGKVECVVNKTFQNNPRFQEDSGYED